MGAWTFGNCSKIWAFVWVVRLHLQHVGPRDAAKVLGGCGPCGQSLCCSTFLKETPAVNLKLAKEQRLSLTPSKISGACGRLMCCLRYEVEFYRDANQRLPKNGANVDTPEGPGTVIEVNVFNETVFVRLGDGRHISVEGETLRSLREERGRGEIVRESHRQRRRLLEGRQSARWGELAASAFRQTARGMKKNVFALAAWMLPLTLSGVAGQSWGAPVADKNPVATPLEVGKTLVVPPARGFWTLGEAARRGIADDKWPLTEGEVFSNWEMGYGAREARAALGVKLKASDSAICCRHCLPLRSPKPEDAG